VASTLVAQRILTPAQVPRAFPSLASTTTSSRRARLPELEIVISGRNDGYGGPDFHERMIAAAAFNHARLAEAGVPHRFTLVEWNTPDDGRPSLASLVKARLPWWHRACVVSPAWHTWLSENPRLQFMEFFAKNVGIRRAEGDWVLTTNSDVFLSREVVARLAEGRLEPGTLYRRSTRTASSACRLTTTAWPSRHWGPSTTSITTDRSSTRSTPTPRISAMPHSVRGGMPGSRTGTVRTGASPRQWKRPDQIR
jgi:hypothetical protein